MIPGARDLERARPDVVARRIVDLAEGRTIAWAELGKGADCLVVHGTLMTLEESWLGPAAALAETFRVVAVDRPGHGGSARRRLVDASPWRQAALLHAFAEAIGMERPVLVGHSFGGTVALAYAMLYPNEVSGVVAVAPMCLPETRVEAVLFGPRAVPGLGDWLAQALGASSDPVLLPLLWRAMFLPQTMPPPFAEHFPFAFAARAGQMIAEGEDAMALSAALTSMAVRYQSCHVPTRFLCGTADLVVNNAAQGAVAAALMPDATIEWIPGAGHMLHHFEQHLLRAAALSLR